jgi:hypothetical protein
MFADGTTGSTAYRGYIGYDHSNDSMNFASHNYMNFYSAGLERMRIDSNGNIAIGGTSASNFSGYVTLDLRDTTGGLIDFSEAGAGVFARIQAVVNNSLNINNRQAYPVTFGTNDTERMRIDSSGNLLVGTTSAVDSSNTISKNSGSNNAVLSVIDTNPSNFGSRVGLNVRAGTYNSADSSSLLIRFQRGDGTTVGSIGRSGASAVSYNTSSDARLKDITGEARGLEVINELNPVAYNWKESGQADEGLIAQEVMDIVPNAVSGSEEEMYQMDYSKLVVHLVKGMKEQQEQIEALQSEINLLKGE